MSEGQPWGAGAVGHASLPRTGQEVANDGAASRKAAQVQHYALFVGISPQDCRDIVSAAHEQEYARRQTIYLEGDLVRNVVLLTSGSVKVVQFGRNGTEVILRLDGPGEFVGTTGLCSKARYGSRAQAVGKSKALVWETTGFESLSQKYPMLRRNAAQILCRQLEDLEERFRLVSTEKVAARLSHQLIRLVSRVGHLVDGNVEIGLSREELAQLIGTTLFTVSRLLSDWDHQGIVNARREAVSVRNMQALVELSESE